MLILIFVLLLSGICTAISAEEFRPVNVWTDAEAFSDASGIQNLFDGNWTTHACLQDTTRTSKRKNVSPEGGGAPVTALLVVDFGQTRELAGVRLVSRDSWVNVMAKNVTIFICDDAEGKTNRRNLLENEALPPVNNSYSAFLQWEKQPIRFLGIQVNDSFQQAYEGRIHWGGAWTNVLTRNGDDTAGLGTFFNTQIAEITGFDALPTDFPAPNAPEAAFPVERLHRDWIYQDFGPKFLECFISKTDSKIETSMLEKVLNEIRDENPKKSELVQRFDALKAAVTGCDARWKELYFDACAVRRAQRLEFLKGKARQYIYVKHYVMDNYDNTLTDEQYKSVPQDFSPEWSELCLLTLHDDASVTNEVLLERPHGVICSPELSFDAKTLIFSMRDNFETSNYHLYTMDLATRKVTQITHSPERDGRVYPTAERFSCFLPTGEILFSSTRCVQINDCWPTQNSDLYVCKPDGTGLRRLTFDQLLTDRPQVLNDGRVIYSRWEYNDRNAYYLHPFFVMNQDGTSQTEFYGNNSEFPSGMYFARPIPGSSKVLCILGGHHSIVKGKLALLDRSRGTQENVGIEFVAGASPDRKPGRQPSDVHEKSLWDWEIDFFGQDGPQYDYPFAFDEENYLCAFCPEGWIFRYGPFHPPFGSYYMTADGKRELLAFDWRQCVGLMIPVMEREVPPVKIGTTDPSSNHGMFYVQNIYLGPGLAGVEPGTVKKLRVAALEYRPCKMGAGWNHGESGNGISQTPPSFVNGSWDVKHVLGEVDVEADGSCCFMVPARTPVYFQMLDERGRCVQTMRSWATLQPGEQFACLGCHESKTDTLFTGQTRPTLAMRRAPQMLQPFAGKEHPLITRLKTQNQLDSARNYLGVNEPCEIEADAPVDGFSYVQEIQPILDRHCVRCHDGTLTKTDSQQNAEQNALRATVDMKIVQFTDDGGSLTTTPESDTNSDTKSNSESDSNTDSKLDSKLSSEGRKTLYAFDSATQKSALDLTGRIVPEEELLEYKINKSPEYTYLRNFTQSYLALTHHCRQENNPWMKWLDPRSRAQMLPPYHTGSVKSPILDFLEPTHYGVQVSENEKRTFACWIDLVVPFCGSHAQGNTWTDEQKAEFQYFLEKRLFFAEEEVETLKKEQ